MPAHGTTWTPKQRTSYRRKIALNKQKRDSQYPLALAKILLDAWDAEQAQYHDIICRGGNPAEYGMRTRQQVYADILVEELK